MNTCQAGGPTLAISPEGYELLRLRLIDDMEAGRTAPLLSYMETCPGREVSFVDFVETMILFARCDIDGSSMAGVPPILNPAVANGIARIEGEIAAWRDANPDAEDTQTEDDDQ